MSRSTARNGLGSGGNLFGVRNTLGTRSLYAPTIVTGDTPSLAVSGTDVTTNVALSGEVCSNPAVSQDLVCLVDSYPAAIDSCKLNSTFGCVPGSVIQLASASVMVALRIAVDDKIADGTAMLHGSMVEYLRSSSSSGDTELRATLNRLKPDSPGSMPLSSISVVLADLGYKFWTPSPKVLSQCLRSSLLGRMIPTLTGDRFLRVPCSVLGVARECRVMSCEPTIGGLVTESTRIDLSMSRLGRVSVSSKVDPEERAYWKGFSGFTTQKQTLERLVMDPLLDGKSCASGVLIHGPRGSGKSQFLQAIVESLRSTASNTLLVDLVPLLRSASVGELGNINDLSSANPSDSTSPTERLISAKIGEWVRLNALEERTIAQSVNPLVIFLLDDGLEFMETSSASRQFASCLVKVFKGARNFITAGTSGFQLNSIVLASVVDPDDLDPMWLRPGRLECQVELSIVAGADKTDILKSLASTYSQGQYRSAVAFSLTEDDYAMIGRCTPGYLVCDLEALVAKVCMNRLAVHLGADTCIVGLKDILDTVKLLRPSGLREIALEVPQTSWDDIGGYEDVKQSLIEAVVWPIEKADHFTRLNVRPPCGVLLYGPPGCSKTMMARAVARSGRMNFISVKGPEIFSKWVGDSERAIRDLFRKARSASPCVIFFDEIDAVAGVRDSSSSGVSDRVLAQLLTEMDGFSTLNHVILLAATNRPQSLDSALLRAGRLDRLIYVGLPNRAARTQIITNCLSKTPNSVPDSCIPLLADSLRGYSGAEIVMLFKESAILAIREVPRDASIATDSLSDSPLPLSVSWDNVERTLKGLKPRTDVSLLESYEVFRTDHASGE